MSKHTAAEVNRLITHLDPTRTETMMLHAYADLLSAQEKTEPVAWMRPSKDGFDSAFRDSSVVKRCAENTEWNYWVPLYAHPPAQAWIPVTGSLEKKIEQAINSVSAENASNTPDYILAQFLTGCLATFNTAVQQRETWYGRDPRPVEAVQHLPPPPEGAGHD